MKITNDYIDFEIIDTSRGMKLERWKDIYLLRPDPEIMWDNGNLEEIYHNKINSIGKIKKMFLIAGLLVIMI